MKILALLVVVPAFALAQSNPDSRGGAAVCPLSDEQTDASMAAFAKIVPTLKDEPRCTNCHGGVNPFIDGVGDPNDSTASRTEHGGGKMDKFVPGTPATADRPAIPSSPQTECDSCHNNLAPKHPSGEPSVWKMAPDFLAFVGKDAATLCAQIKDFSRGCSGGICGPWPDAEKFVAHLTDDEGHDNFTATAFSGNRGLTPAEFPEIAPQPPVRITAAGLVALGREWVDATDGEFKGDKTCGCEPAHYALRISAATEFDRAAIHYKSVLRPVDIPITFEDHGTFKGKGEGVFEAASLVSSCTGQSTTSIDFNVTGKAVQTAHERSFHIKVGTTTASRKFDAQCAPVAVSAQDTRSQETVMEFDLDGDVGEFVDRPMAAPMPGFSSSARVQIVKLK